MAILDVVVLNKCRDCEENISVTVEAIDSEEFEMLVECGTAYIEYKLDTEFISDRYLVRYNGQVCEDCIEE